MVELKSKPKNNNEMATMRKKLLFYSVSKSYLHTADYLSENLPTQK
jgi:hypothetical protein